MRSYRNALESMRKAPIEPVLEAPKPTSTGFMPRVAGMEAPQQSSLPVDPSFVAQRTFQSINQAKGRYQDRLAKIRAQEAEASTKKPTGGGLLSRPRQTEEETPEQASYNPLDVMQSDNSTPATPRGRGNVQASRGAPNSLLDIIDRTESGGDYDALFGFSNRSGPFSNIRVTDMTIDQVVEFSRPSGAYGQWVKGQVGRVATPMGRYQIVGTTLRNAVDEMGLDRNTRFTPEVQDQIASHLARRRLQSASTMEGKMRALRAEWEGFKHVSDAQLMEAIRGFEI